jgi:hypothetical protein
MGRLSTALLAPASSTSHEHMISSGPVNFPGNVAGGRMPCTAGTWPKKLYATFPQTHRRKCPRIYRRFAGKRRCSTRISMAPNALMAFRAPAADTLCSAILPGSRTALRPASITRRFGPLSSECECNRTPHGIRIFVEIFDLRLSPMGVYVRKPYALVAIGPLILLDGAACLQRSATLERKCARSQRRPVPS